MMHTRYLRDGWNIVRDKYVSRSFMGWKHFRAMGRPIEYQVSETYSDGIHHDFCFNAEGIGKATPLQAYDSDFCGSPIILQFSFICANFLLDPDITNIVF